MSRDHSPSISQSSSFSVDLVNNPFLSPRSTSEASVGPLTSIKKRTPEEIHLINKANETFRARLKSDYAAVLEPDIDSPFVDVSDVVKRLLPFHVYTQPQDDLNDMVKGEYRGAASPAEVVKTTREIMETKFALECFKRRAVLRAKFRNITCQSSKRSSPDDQSYFLAQTLLDYDRSESGLLNSELRTARAELERLEREKRTNAAAYYRTYPFSYMQAYNGSTQPTTYVTPLPAMASVPATAAIPVQLPVASLPALHALGIVPVPATSLPLEGQPQPPAVLRGSSSNGTMLSLEINVSLLHSAQMSGLALVLNSLMSRTSAGASSSDTS